MNPAMVFADEPTGNLDTKTGAQIMDLFKELNNAGHTIILVTHDKDIAERMGKVLAAVDDKLNDKDIAAQTKRQIEIRDGRIKEA